jgi:hypothetical protein
MVREEGQWRCRSAFADHAVQLPGDEGELVPQSQGRLAIMQDGECDLPGEAESDETAVRIESEGLGV